MTQFVKTVEKENGTHRPTMQMRLQKNVLIFILIQNQFMFSVHF